MSSSDQHKINWCHSTVHRAVQALVDNHTDTGKMGEQHPVQQKSCICRSQKGTAATFGIAPAFRLNNADKEAKELPGNLDKLVLGIGRIVPRWDVSPALELRYFVRSDTFSSADDAKDAGQALQEAAAEWNTLNLDLTIKSTDDQKAAHFYLIYRKEIPGSPGVLAEAFFPNEIGQDVIVYDLALRDSDNREILKNVFLHELGHVLGLRHEFAIVADAKGHGPEGEGAVQFGFRNPNSVMAYVFPPELQDTDKDDVVRFYRLPEGTPLGARRQLITDYVPKLRSELE